MGVGQQLPLPLGLDPQYTFERFFPGPNEEVLELLKRAALGSGAMPLLIHGPHASGKTHLLQASCAMAGGRGLSAMTLPLRVLINQGTQSIDGLGAFDCICLDDLDCAVGNSAWEEALFLLFNTLYDRQAQLIVAASKPPADLPFVLEDLRSRMSSGPIVALKPLGETESMEALIGHASALGLEMTEAVAQYLVRRVDRNLGSLLRHLDHLDRASMAASRKLTIPFIRTVLDAAS